MKIQWLGHSSFKLEESTGTSIVTDPFEESVVGFPMPKVNANAVTISHKQSRRQSYCHRRTRRI